MKALPIQFHESIPAWEKAIYVFLRREGAALRIDANGRRLH